LIPANRPITFVHRDNAWPGLPNLPKMLDLIHSFVRLKR